MSDIRWQGMSHREIYNAVWSGPGPAGSSAPETVWRAVEESLNDVADTLGRGTGRARNDWTGTAAERAVTGITALALHAREASAAASRLRGAVVAQGEYIGYVRNTLPAPPPEGSDAAPFITGIPPIDFFTLSDWQAVEAQHADLAQQAVHVMETYEGNSEQNKPYIQSFASPAAVTTGGGLGGIASVFGSLRNTVGQIAATAAGAVGAGIPVLPGGSPVAIGAAAGAAGAAGLPIAVAGGVGVPPALGLLRPSAGTAAGRVLPPQIISPGAVVAPPGTRPGTAPGAVRTPQTSGAAGLPPGSAPVAGRGGIGGIGSGGTGSAGIRSGGIGGTSSLPRGIPGGFGGVEPTTPRGLPGGIGAGGEVGRPMGTSPTASPATTTGGGTGAGRAGTHGFFPPGGGAGGGQSREHRRPPYLIDDTDAFGDDRYFTPQVITPDDYIPRRT